LVLSVPRETMPISIGMTVFDWRSRGGARWRDPSDGRGWISYNKSLSVYPEFPVPPAVRAASMILANRDSRRRVELRPALLPG
jgi:hypothetical protein